jgi:hypothetical protein
VAIVLIIILAIILVVVLRVAIVGLALKLLWWALVGLVVGALARLVLPGATPRSAGWQRSARASPARFWAGSSATPSAGAACSSSCCRSQQPRC